MTHDDLYDSLCRLALLKFLRHSSTEGLKVNEEITNIISNCYFYARLYCVLCLSQSEASDYVRFSGIIVVGSFPVLFRHISSRP